MYIRCVGSGALSGKLLLVKIVEHNKINACFRAGKLCPAGLEKGPRWIRVPRRG